MFSCSKHISTIIKLSTSFKNRLTKTWVNQCWPCCKVYDKWYEYVQLFHEKPDQRQFEWKIGCYSLEWQVGWRDLLKC